MEGNPTAARVKAEQFAPMGGYRRDIQGLRALAVVLVVLAHTGPAWLAGGYVGVDVFFVISGFLITGLLIKEIDERGAISFRLFYARRARRILPAATLVLFGTIAATYALLGPVRAAELAPEAIWAVAFSLNWRYAANGTDYFSAGLPPSPLQHYWSLAVEEQFYLGWPVLLLVLVVGVRARSGHKAPSRSRWVLVGCILGIISAALFAYSVVATEQQPAAAYFSSLTRGWELGVGALLALNVTRLSAVPAMIKAATGWAGLVIICGSAVLISATTPFPGGVAALPVTGAALVIAGGLGRPGYGPVLLLGRGPAQWVGARSYSLYLWHWPVLVIAASYVGVELSFRQAAAAVGVALLLTVATYRWVEHPIHRADRYAGRRALVLWPACSAAVCLGALLTVYVVPAPPAGTPLRPRPSSVPPRRPPSTVPRHRPGRRCHRPAPPRPAHHHLQIPWCSPSRPPWPPRLRVSRSRKR